MVSKVKSKKKTSVKKNVKALDQVKKVVFSSQGFPIFLTLSIICVMFVIYRMKTVEIDYKSTDLDRKIDKVTLENKELKAQKARQLSVKKLKAMARKYHLSQPKQSQIIVIK